jgi:hypothetical protein
MAAFAGFVFAIEVDGKATLAFEAKNFREAFELCKEDWLRADLSAITSNGISLCSETAKLTVRKADRQETLVYRNAALQVQTDDLLLAYLVELDGSTQPDSE